MSKNKHFALIAILVLVLATFSLIAFRPVIAQPQTIVVPDNYSTIQAAINNAVNGDTIFVKTGVYEEQVLTLNKTIALIGEGPSNTIIDLYPPSGPYGILGSSGIENPVNIEANDAILTNFTINSHGQPGGGTTGGFVSATGSRIEIIGNIINTGISAVGDETIIANNTATALFLSGSNQTVAQNTISGGGYGIWMENSVNNLVIKNSIAPYGSGAYDSGIDLRSSTLNQFVANNISGSICVQIDNYYGTSDLQTRESADNIFYENNFISSTTNLIDQVGSENGVYSVHNTWCNGAKGNYWSNYASLYPNATEIDNSGIGDAPYVIDANNKDFYPLIAPYNISSVKVQLPAHPLISNFSTTPSPSQVQSPSPSSSEKPTNSPKLQPPKPFPTVTIAAVSGTIIAVIALGAALLVYSKKHEH
ncbi:MAG: NosD domain-containing protein [Candidatus Bathyarchaeia archaeon]|jgi:parallel beta-helix repeat protein